MIENSMIINDKMPEYTVDRVNICSNEHKKARMIRSRARSCVRKNIDDYRESPALNVIRYSQGERRIQISAIHGLPKYKRNGRVAWRVSAR